MPFIKFWVHLVWSTKHRQPLLTKNIRQNVFTHIRNNGLEKGIQIDFVNGYTDHVHCLISLTTEQTISKVVQLIKGESAFWINKHNLCATKFEWQTNYFAASVSHSGIDAVREYIKKQEEHHKIKTFAEEYEAFMNKYGFKLIGDSNDID